MIRFRGRAAAVHGVRRNRSSPELLPEAGVDREVLGPAALSGLQRAQPLLAQPAAAHRPGVWPSSVRPAKGLPKHRSRW